MQIVKIIAACLCIALTNIAAQAQNLSSVEGRVIDAKTREAVSFATVYLARTSMGVSADENGVFKIEKIPEGKYDLSATMMGYKTFSQPVQFNGTSVKNFMIPLVTDPSALDSVVVTARRAKSTSSAYSQFKKIFIGHTKNATQCQVLNSKDIMAYKENDQLKAFAKKPIEIINKALGYKLYYTLNEFTVDYKLDRVIIAGSPRFEELKPENAKQEKKWTKERDRAYYGSAEHFLRSLKQHQVEQNSFVVQNGEGRMLREKDLIKDNNIYFKGIINVIFTKEVPENLQTATYMRTTTSWASGQQSQINFIGKPIKVHDNGYFEDYRDILFLGYFSVIDNMAELMPLGYQPSYKLNEKK